jgi:nitroreductase
MTKTATPNLPERAGYLIGVAARAPSVHNTQPWRFKVSEREIELYADARRQLPEDPAGREMLISCGGALYGLRLGIRSLGYRPQVELLPESARRLLACVRLGDPAPVTSDERKLLQAVPHRHTHRGGFEAGSLPAGLLTHLKDDAAAEGATLTVLDQEPAARKLAAILAGWDPGPVARADVTRWTRHAGSHARDGVPAHAFPAEPGRGPGRLPQRDFDLGRGWGLLPSGGPPAPVTAVLVTPGDDARCWLRAGQALQRLLLRAATRWVFADLQTQPLQAPAIRGEIQDSLALPGWPQMLLQLGTARATHPTARRPAEELTR